MARRIAVVVFVAVIALVVLVVGLLPAVQPSTNSSQSSASAISTSSTSEAYAATTTNCSGPDTYCGPYILMVNTSIISSTLLGGNESRLSGTIVCTHPNLSPPSSIELEWLLPNPVDGGYPVGVNVTTIHIVTTGSNWTLAWSADSQGRQQTSYSFAIPKSELEVYPGMNYTVRAVANWSSGPLSHSTPADIETVTVTSTTTNESGEYLDSITLPSGVGLCSSNCLYPSPYLFATVLVNATRSPLSGIHLEINGTDEGVTRTFGGGQSSNFAYEFKANPQNPALPIVPGKTYAVVLIATFGNGDISAATANIVAS